MKFILNKDVLKVENNERYNSGSVKYYEAEVEFDDTWTNLTIEAVLVKKGEEVGISRSTIDNKIYIDKNENGRYYIGFVGYTIENNEKTYQISTNLQEIKLRQGAGEIETENEELPTPSQWEVYIAQIQELIDGVVSIPLGGTTGQALVKKTNADGDVEWKTIQGGSSVSSYNDLSNKPKINNIELIGNKSLSDLGINTPTTLAELSDDSTHRLVTDTEKTMWNNKANINDIPTKTNDLTNDSGFITSSVNNLTNYTLKTNTGSFIDLEINQTTYIVTLKLKDVDGNIISTDTIDLPLENVVVSGTYDSTNQKIVLTLQSGNTVDIPVGALISGLQSEITSQNKLSSDLVDDTNSGNKFVSTSEKQTWNNKYNKPSGGIPSTDMSSAVQTSLGKADTAIQTHQDISGKLDTSKVKNSQSTTAGDVYDVRYINTMIGNIESLLGGI